MKYKKVEMYFPGGCSIGARPIDQTLKAFKLLGATIKEEDSVFTIRVKALDKKTTFEEKINIEVLPEATIKFESDKQYVFPTIPFTLTWETENAKKVIDLLYGLLLRSGNDSSIVLAKHVGETEENFVKMMNIMVILVLNLLLPYLL